MVRIPPGDTSPTTAHDLTAPGTRGSLFHPDRRPSFLETAR